MRNKHRFFFKMIFTFFVLFEVCFCFAFFCCRKPSELIGFKLIFRYVFGFCSDANRKKSTSKFEYAHIFWFDCIKCELFSCIHTFSGFFSRISATLCWSLPSLLLLSYQFMIIQLNNIGERIL